MGVECSEVCVRQESGSRSWERMGGRVQRAVTVKSFLPFRDVPEFSILLSQKGHLS